MTQCAEKSEGDCMNAHRSLPPLTGYVLVNTPCVRSKCSQRTKLDRVTLISSYSFRIIINKLMSHCYWLRQYKPISCSFIHAKRVKVRPRTKYAAFSFNYDQLIQCPISVIMNSPLYVMKSKNFELLIADQFVSLNCNMLLCLVQGFTSATVHKYNTTQVPPNPLAHRNWNFFVQHKKNISDLNSSFILKWDVIRVNYSLFPLSE